MADYDPKRRRYSDDGGDMCAGLSSKIWLRNEHYLLLV